MYSAADKERVEGLLSDLPDSRELSLRQASCLLPYAYPTVLRLSQNGHLRTIKKGGRYIVLVEELRRFNREGNYDSAREDIPPRHPDEVAKDPLPITTHKDGSVSLDALTPEQRDRLGTSVPIPINPTTKD